MENMKIGSLLKWIRQGKGMRQKEVCGTFITRAALSKIENNKAIPNYRTLSYILNVLDVSFDEFEYLRNDYDLKKEIISKFWSIPDNTFHQDLEDTIKLCNIFLEKKSDHLILDIRTLSKVLISLPNISVEGISKNEMRKISSIWDRINKMDLWTINELKLASCAIFYFPIETSLHIASRIEKELSRYESLKSTQTFITSEYINLTTLYMQNEDWVSMARLNEKALKLSKRINRFDYFYFCYVRKGIHEKSKYKINKGIFILEQFEKNNYVNDLNQEIKSCFPKISKPIILS